MNTMNLCIFIAKSVILSYGIFNALRFIYIYTIFDREKLTLVAMTCSTYTLLAQCFSFLERNLLVIRPALTTCAKD